MTDPDPKPPRKERDPLDRYYTPDHVARAIVRRLRADYPAVRTGPLWEPHAGRGAFLRALCEPFGDARPFVRATDVDPESAAHRVGISGPGAQVIEGIAPFDFLDPDYVDFSPRYGTIIGNPPFTGWERHAEAAIRRRPDVVAFLLRASSLFGFGRVLWWKQYPADAVYPITPRPSFTADGSDQADSVVIVWTPNDPPSLTEWRAPILAPKPTRTAKGHGEGP